MCDFYISIYTYIIILNALGYRIGGPSYGVLISGGGGGGLEHYVKTNKWEGGKKGGGGGGLEHYVKSNKWEGRNKWGERGGLEILIKKGSFVKEIQF